VSKSPLLLSLPLVDRAAGFRLLIDFSRAVVVPCRLLPVALVVSDPRDLDPEEPCSPPPFPGVSAPSFLIDLRRFGRVICG
jgi:hypothetical protein